MWDLGSERAIPAGRLAKFLAAIDFVPRIDEAISGDKQLSLHSQRLHS